MVPFLETRVTHRGPGQSSNYGKHPEGWVGNGRHDITTQNGLQRLRGGVILMPAINTDVLPGVFCSSPFARITCEWRAGCPSIHQRKHNPRLNFPFFFFSKGGSEPVKLIYKNTEMWCFLEPEQWKLMLTQSWFITLKSSLFGERVGWLWSWASGPGRWVWVQSLSLAPCSKTQKYLTSLSFSVLI